MGDMRDTQPMKDLSGDACDVSSFRNGLLAWYDTNRRDLPWRATRDPYAVWVSEVMLQQTQVSRVVDYWPRFLERFPTVAALAQAAPDDVLGLWSGLGYYRRARLLHEAAREVVDSCGGTVPSSAAELRELPGMGEYTAAAVASIAFGEAVPVIDANVARVLARVLAIEGDVTRGDGRRALREDAARLLDRDRPGDYNQAVMELGALVCTPASPHCEPCPVAAHCRAVSIGDPTAFPKAAAAPRTVALFETAAVIVSGGRVLLERGSGRGWWEGLWTLPRVPLEEGDDPEAAVREVLAARHSVALQSPDGPLDGPLEERYSVTNHRVTMLVYTLAHGGRDSAARGADDSSRWFTSQELAEIGVPAPDRRVIERVLRSRLESPGASTRPGRRRR